LRSFAAIRVHLDATSPGETSGTAGKALRTVNGHVALCAEMAGMALFAARL
jgi:hypothetical protein